MRRGRLKDDTEDFSLSKGWMELTSIEMGILWEEQIWKEEDQEIVLGC